MVLNSSNLAPAKLAGNDGSANGGGLRLAGTIGTGTLSGTLLCRKSASAGTGLRRW